MDGQLHLRIPQKLLNDFKTKSDLLGRHHGSVLRELVEAFIDGRLTIKATEQQKELYK